MEKEGQSEVQGEHRQAGDLVKGLEAALQCVRKILHRGGKMLSTASQWGEGTEGDQDGEGCGGDV